MSDDHGRKIHFSITTILAGFIGMQQYADRVERDFFIVRDPQTLSATSVPPKIGRQISHDSKLGVTRIRASRSEIKAAQIPPGFIIEGLIEYHTEACAGPPTTQQPCPPCGTPDLPAPPGQGTQTVDWGVSRVHAVEAQRIADSSTVKVCVTDTGIDRTHPDLKYIAGQDFTGKGDFQDGAGHGTHTAGLVAAVNNSIGVVGASQAQLLIAKVLNDQGSGTNDQIAQGVAWCVDQGAQIISMSLGGPQASQVLYNALSYAYSKGVRVFIAMGNEGNAQPNWPAAFAQYLPNIAAIGALDQNDQVAQFSSFGPWIAMSCPGVDILSTMPGGTYGKMSGTSMATPICAGVAALALASHKQLKFKPLGDHNHYGMGLPNALETVSQ